MQETSLGIHDPVRRVRLASTEVGQRRKRPWKVSPSVALVALAIVGRGEPEAPTGCRAVDGIRAQEVHVGLDHPRCWTVDGFRVGLGRTHHRRRGGVGRIASVRIVLVYHLGRFCSFCGCRVSCLLRERERHTHTEN